MHEFRLSDHNTSGPARRQDEPESDGRKRRRLVSITVAAEQLSEDVKAEVVQLSKAPSAESPTEPGAWDHLSKWIQAASWLGSEMREIRGGWLKAEWLWTANAPSPEI